MVRMGPQMGPRLGPTLGPNPAAGDPLAGYVSTFTTSFGDGFVFPDTDPNRITNGAGAFRLSSTGALPDGLLAATDYWAGGAGGGQIQLALSQADALASIFVSFNDDGTGTHTLTYVG